MNVAFYAPFKPLDHPDPSGDRTIGRELAAALTDQGIRLTVASRFRARWLSCRPRLWIEALFARRAALEAASRAKGPVGILGTRATIQSGAYEAAIRQPNCIPGAEVNPQ